MCALAGRDVGSDGSVTSGGVDRRSPVQTCGTRLTPHPAAVVPCMHAFVHACRCTHHEPSSVAGLPDSPMREIIAVGGLRPSP